MEVIGGISPPRFLTGSRPAHSPLAVTGFLIKTMTPLLRWCDSAHHVSTRLNTGRRPVHHRLGLVRNDPDQRPNGEAVSHKHERSRSAPVRHYLLELAESDRRAWIPVRNESPRAFDLADGHQGGRVHAATHG